MSTIDVLKSNISNLYFGFFGHVPDADGLASWVAQVQSNQITLADVATALASQSEAKTKYSYLVAPNLQANITTFLNGVYQNLFHRNTDPSSLTLWSQQLLNGRAASDVVLDIISSAQGGDATTLGQSVALANVSPTNAPAVSIAELYIGFFGRNADPTGLASWSAALQSQQMSLQDIARLFAAHAEAKNAYAYLNAPDLQQNITTFLGGVYQSLFHRAIDPLGLATWSGQLLAGQSAASVVLAISQNASGTDVQALLDNAAAASGSVTDTYKAGVSKLYIALLGRAADPASLNSWVGQLNAGQATLASIADALVLLPEAKAAHAYLSATNLQLGITGFLNEVYQNLFHRNADSGGLTSWTNNLLTGETAASLVQEIIAGAQNSDVTALANRTTTALGYTAAVLTAGVNWTAVDDRADAVQVLAGVTDDTTTVTAASTLTATLVAAEAAPFILTASSPSVNEGSNAVFTLATKGIAPGSLYNYQLSGVQGADIQGGALSGTAVIDAQGKALVSIGLIADSTTEGNETLTLSIAGQSTAVTVVDTSLDPTNFTLTAGIDAVTGTPRDDTITSVASGGLGVLDSIDGGAGIDTLNVSDASPISAVGNNFIRNIEIANLASISTVTANTTGWTGLTNLNAQSYAGGNTLTASGTTAVNATSFATGAAATSINGGSAVTVVAAGSTTGGITVGNTIAPTDVINISNTSTGAVSMGVVAVTGGTTVNVTQAATNAVNTTTTLGTINVAGGSGTTAVTVSNQRAATQSAGVAGVTENSVSISDVNNASTTAAGTITSATVNGYTTLTINDNALTTLAVTNGSGNIFINNGNLDTPTNTTLNVTASGLTGGSLIDAGVYRTLNLTTTGANSTLANVSQSALTSLTVAGTKRLTLTSTAGMAALRTATVTGSAGLAADLSTSGSVTAIDTSGTTGASAITVNASRATFNGGAGADTVTVVTGLTKAISLGDGDDSLIIGALVPTASIAGGPGTDSLSIDATAAATASGSQSFAGLVTGFEQLVLTGATNQAIDLAVLGISNQVTTSGGNGLTLSNLVNGGRLVLKGAGTAYTIGNSAFAGGTNDTVNITLTSDAGSAGTNFASTGITTSGVENLVVTTVDSNATPSGLHDDAVTLLGNSSKTVTVSGNAGLTLTQTSTGLNLIDASGIALGGFTYTSGALNSAATIKGSATGTNTVDYSAATQAVTYIGGSGNDAVTSGSGRSDTVTLGDGTNSYTGSSGNKTITGGSGADTVTVTTGNNTVNLGDGTNSFTATSGNNTYVGGAGIDTVTVGGGFNTVTLGAGANVFSQNAVNANLNTYTTILDARAGDTMVFLNQGTEVFNSTKVVLANTAVFQDYADAVIQQGGDSTANGHFGWFQYSGDTYLVEDRHNGSTSPSFSNGTDTVVKLTGLVDLSGATLNSSNSLLLA